MRSGKLELKCTEYRMQGVPYKLTESIKIRSVQFDLTGDQSNSNKGALKMREKAAIHSYLDLLVPEL